MCYFLLVSVAISESLLVFYDPDALEEYRSVILYNISQFGFVWCFLMVGVRLQKALESEHILQSMLCLNLMSSIFFLSDT